MQSIEILIFDIPKSEVGANWTVKIKSTGQSLTLVSHRTVFEHSLLFHMFESNHSSPTRVSSHRPSLLVWCRYLHTRRTYTTANANNCFTIHAEYQARNMLYFYVKSHLSKLLRLPRQFQNMKGCTFWWMFFLTMPLR